MCAHSVRPYPDRTAALVLYGSYAKGTVTADYPHGLAEQEAIDEFIRGADRALGRCRRASRWRRKVLQTIRCKRPSGVTCLCRRESGRHVLTRMNATVDIRHVLPVIAVPTLVIHRSEDMIVPVEAGRDLAAKIKVLKYVELSGEDHLWFHGDADAILGEWRDSSPGPRGRDRRSHTRNRDVYRHRRSPPGRPPRSVTAAGGTCSRATTRSCAVSSSGTGAAEQRHSATFPGHLRWPCAPPSARATPCSARDAMRDQGRGAPASIPASAELIGEDLGGVAVNIGARVGSVAGPGEVLVSRTVTDLVAGSGIEFTDRGMHSLKGVPGGWQLYAVKE